MTDLRMTVLVVGATDSMGRKGIWQGFVGLLNPHTDQVPADIVALRQPMQRLAGEKLLCDLALELDAMRAVLGHGLPSCESPP